ncbi:MAG TPA: transferrin-binding protein-like solute binding protein [Burkholderiales bacterium]|nr:transferrin-binding protein-like solute binding protein [Burkholderiales bacterium]
MYSQNALVFLIAAALLAACNGSGGNSAVMPVPFTSFSAVQNGQPVQANGISQTANVASTTSTTLNLVDTANSSAQFTYTGIGTLVPAMTALAFNAPGTNVSWSGATVDCTTLAPLCTASNSSSTGVVVNALNSSLAWNYQSFGYWLVTTSISSTVVGAMSFGSRTPVAGVPIAGSGAYTGRSGGAYVDPNGNLFTFSGTMNSTVDFVGRTILFSSSATQVTAVSGGTLPPSSALTINTSLSYAKGTNQFSGPVTAPGQGAGLSGTLNGSFYGPTAQEIGGTFSLNTTTSREAMVGGFGGKR